MTEIQEIADRLIAEPDKFGDSELSENVAQEVLHKIKSAVFGYGRINYDAYKNDAEYEEALYAEVEFECGELGFDDKQTQQILAQLG